MNLRFIGGPRDGTTRAYKGFFKSGPGAVGCVDEAKKAGMHGVYRRIKEEADGTLVFEWRDLPKRIKL